MPTATYNFREGYRYGFNGQEKDDNIKGGGNSYDFGARMLDVRLGRWFVIDPKWKLFSNISPYTFALNNSIYFIDSDGKVIEVANEKSKEAFNSSIQNIFTGNDIVINLLTIASSSNSLSGITSEDAVKALNTLTDPDQRAAFNGLVMTANSEKTYNLTFLEEGSKAAIGNIEVSELKIALEADGIAINDNSESNKVEIFVAESSVGVLKSPLTLRNKNSLVIGSILSQFIKGDEKFNESSIVEPNSESAALIQIQVENTLQRAQGLTQLRGDDFKKSNSEKFSKVELAKVKIIPIQLKMVEMSTTKEQTIIDITKFNNNSDAKSDTKSAKEPK